MSGIASNPDLIIKPSRKTRRELGAFQSGPNYYFIRSEMLGGDVAEGRAGLGRNATAWGPAKHGSTGGESENQLEGPKQSFLA